MAGCGWAGRGDMVWVGGVGGDGVGVGRGDRVWVGGVGVAG